MSFYGAAQIERENQLLQAAVEATLTGTCTLSRRDTAVTNGIPSDDYDIVAEDIRCAINHWEERPGRDQGVTMLSGNRFIGHLLYDQEIKVGDHVLHEDVTYAVDAVNTPVTIQVAQQVHLTVVV